MTPLVALSMLVLTTAPVEVESVELTRWTRELAAPKTRCRALAAIGFQESEWKCLHASAAEKKRVAVVNRYRVAPGVELICAGPRQHRCEQLVALREGHRVPLFVPDLPVPVSEYRVRPGSPLRVSAMQQFDCRDHHGMLISCPSESAVGHVEVTERGVELLSDTRRTTQKPGPYLWPATGSPLRFTHARSVGEVKGRVRWRDDQLCTETRCYDAVGERWLSTRGTLTDGLEVGMEPLSVAGHAVKFVPTFRHECGGYQQLSIDDVTWELLELDVDRMLPRYESEYPTRAITRLVFSPSGRAGVAFVPRFERRAATTADTVRCDDGNVADWHVVAHELYFFENPSAQ